jgi:cohesin loading factor subunit SCC2
MFDIKVEEGADNETKIRTLPYVLVLQAFCIVDPTLCTPVTDPSQFVVTLQPYLKNQVSTAFLLLNFVPFPVKITCAYPMILFRSNE